MSHHICSAFWFEYIVWEDRRGVEQTYVIPTCIDCGATRHVIELERAS